MIPRREGGFLITRIHHLSRRIFSKKLSEHGIDIGPGQGRIIYALWKEDGVSISKLVETTSLGKSTLTDLLDRLSDAGLVTREKHPTDRRSTIIRLTHRANELKDKYAIVSDEMTQLFYQGFNETEILEIENYLRRLLMNLTDAEGRNV